MKPIYTEQDLQNAVELSNKLRNEFGILSIFQLGNPFLANPLKNRNNRLCVYKDECSIAEEFMGLVTEADKNDAVKRQNALTVSLKTNGWLETEAVYLFKNKFADWVAIDANSRLAASCYIYDENGKLIDKNGNEFSIPVIFTDITAEDGMRLLKLKNSTRNIKHTSRQKAFTTMASGNKVAAESARISLELANNYNIGHSIVANELFSNGCMKDKYNDIEVFGAGIKCPRYEELFELRREMLDNKKLTDKAKSVISEEHFFDALRNVWGNMCDNLTDGLTDNRSFKKAVNKLKRSANKFGKSDLGLFGSRKTIKAYEGAIERIILGDAIGFEYDVLKSVIRKRKTKKSKSNTYKIAE